MDIETLRSLKHVNALLNIQSDLKIDLMNSGISDSRANTVSSNFIQRIIDSKDLLSEEAKTEIKLFIK